MPETFDLSGAPTLLEVLVKRLVRPVDDATLERTALHVQDWTGCAFAGSAQPLGRVLASALEAESSGPCLALGQVKTFSPAAAAFHNAGLGNVLEMDDIHRTSRSHTGPVIIPAALAAAQWTGTSPQKFLAAVARGYEAALRIGRSVGPGHYALWHNTFTCGVFWAAAAVADLMQLTQEQTVWALGNAGAQTAGLWRCRHEPVMTKQLHTAHAAQDGLKADIMAKHGLTGPRLMLEGEQGFFAATAPDAGPTAVNATPDARWLIWETSFKPWPSCRFTHTSIDVALDPHEKKPNLDDVKEVVIETYRDSAVICDEPVSTSEIQAKFSLQCVVSSTLLNGPPGLDQFHSATLIDPAISEMRTRCQIAETEQFNDAYPEHYGTAVSLEFSDGSVVNASRVVALGDPENSVAPEAIENKASTLMTDAGLDSSTIAAIQKSCQDLPKIKNLSELIHPLATAAGS